MSRLESLTRHSSAAGGFGSELPRLLSPSCLSPNYTPNRSATTNTVGAIAVYFTADRSGIEQLWNWYLGLTFVVLFSALVVLAQESPSSSPFLTWVTRRFGRARVFGVGALLIESLRIAQTGSGLDAVTLFVAAVFLHAVTTLDWTQFLVRPTQREQYAVFEAAVDPNLLLFTSQAKFQPGQRIRVERGATSLDGHVIGGLAHKTGHRQQVILDEDWRSLLPAAGTECTITSIDEADDTVGFVIEGTNELHARFQPLTEIVHGEALSVVGP